MIPTPQLNLPASLTTTSLEVPAANGAIAPLPRIRIADLARASGFYRKRLGFDITLQIPHVLAHACSGSTGLLLVETGATPGRFERLQRSVDNAPLTAATYRIPTVQLPQLYGRLQSIQHVGGEPLHLTPPALEPWNTWEFSCTDADGNTLVFVQSDSAIEANGLRPPG